MFKKVAIFSGGANPALAGEICQALEVTVGRSKVSRFSDGETFCVIQENVRGVDTYVVQPTCSPVNDSVMELLIMVDALRRASAGSITAVIPYYGYARQDRKVAPRTPITSKLVADLIVAAGVNRIVALDHAVDAGGDDEVGHELRRDRRARRDLAVLAGVAVVRDDGGDRSGGGAAERVDHDQELHHAVVHRRAGGLDDVG